MLKIIQLLVGSAFFLLSLYLSVYGYGRGDPFTLPFVVFTALIAGIFLAPLVAERCSTMFNGLFFPTGGSDVKPELSRPRALIAEHRYAEAETELRASLAAQPNLVDAVRLLANLLHENLGRSDEALALAQQTLTANAWRPGHEQLATLAVDILLDRRDSAAAVELLRACAAKAHGTAAAAHMLERLRHLS